MRLFWFAFCLFVTGIWTMIYFDEELRGKKCLVRENADGSFELVDHTNAD